MRERFRIIYQNGGPFLSYEQTVFLVKSSFKSACVNDSSIGDEHSSTSNHNHLVHVSSEPRTYIFKNSSFDVRTLSSAEFGNESSRGFYAFAQYLIENV